MEPICRIPLQHFLDFDAGKLNQDETIGFLTEILRTQAYLWLSDRFQIAMNDYLSRGLIHAPKVRKAYPWKI